MSILIKNGDIEENGIIIGNIQDNIENNLTDSILDEEPIDVEIIEINPIDFLSEEPIEI